MSSSRLSSRSLSTRLVALTVLLVLAVSVVLAVATTIAIRGYLVGRLDDQLAAARNRAEHPIGGPLDGGPHGDGDGPGLGQGAGTIEAHFGDGSPFGFRVPEHGGPVSLSSAALTELGNVPADAQPRSMSVTGLGSYRTLAVNLPDGRVLVTGLPLRDVDAAVHQLVLLDAGVGLVAVLLVGGLGVRLVRHQLRPLSAVAATAQEVARLPLDRGDVDLSVRVADEYTDPRTEAGQVGSALNHMLNHVSVALHARQESESRARQFLADASHELRTPLATIRGYAELSARPGESSTAQLRSYAGQIESQADRMAGLVDDLLLLARLDAGRPLERVPVDVSRLVTESVAAAQVRSPDHAWGLELPPVPLSTIGDEARLHQVMANLLSNASRHTPAGTTVTVGAVLQDSAVVVTVRDNGPGIDADLRPHVFERFTRGDSSRTRVSGGAGLGLSLVDAIVHAHRGTVALDSGNGHTTFTIRLPRP